MAMEFLICYEYKKAKNLARLTFTMKAYVRLIAIVGKGELISGQSRVLGSEYSFINLYHPSCICVRNS